MEFEKNDLLAELELDDPDLRDKGHDDILVNLVQNPGYAGWIAAKAGCLDWDLEGKACAYEKEFGLKPHTAELRKLTQVDAQVPMVRGEGHQKTIIGFFDLVLRCVVVYKDKVWPVGDVYVEIKPFIENFSEVARKLNLYRKYLQDRVEDPRILLITRAEDYQEAFRSQGFFFYHMDD